MFEKLSEFLDSYLKLGIPGYDFIIAKNGEVIYRRIKGFSDLENKIPMNGEEQFNLYSCSKPVTCTAALQLLEKGMYCLDDPLSDYMPEFKKMSVKTQDEIVPAKNQITIRNLFTMTAGLTYETASPALLRAKEDTKGRCPTRELIRYLAQEPLAYQPGEKWQYSLGHDVLAALIEVLSGMKFQDYVRINIFEPLGMKHSSFLLSDAERKNVVPQYKVADKGEIKRIDNEITLKFGPEYASGGAGCISSVWDYHLFMQALLKGDIILGKDTVRLMSSPQLNEQQQKTFEAYYGNKYAYGLGVRCPKVNGPRTDFGWDGAAGAFMMIDLDAGVTAMRMQHVIGSPNHGGIKEFPAYIREGMSAKNE